MAGEPLFYFLLDIGMYYSGIFYLRYVLLEISDNLVDRCTELVKLRCVLLPYLNYYLNRPSIEICWRYQVYREQPDGLTEIAGHKSLASRRISCQVGGHALRGPSPRQSVCHGLVSRQGKQVSVRYILSQQAFISPCEFCSHGYPVVSAVRAETRKPRQPVSY